MQRRLLVFRALLAEGRFDGIELSHRFVNEVRDMLEYVNLRLEDESDRVELDSIILESVSQGKTPASNLHVPITPADHEPPAGIDAGDARDAVQTGADAHEASSDPPAPGPGGADPVLAATRNVMRRSRSLFCANVPLKIGRSELQAILKDFPGFRRLALSSPSESGVRLPL